MGDTADLNFALLAAEEARGRVEKCIDSGQSFVLEAGAGAGKTYSLIDALKYLIRLRGTQLIKNHQKVACITFTNVAKNEIDARTDGHGAIYSDTIHGFCWSLIRQFQSALRSALPKVEKWQNQLAELGEIGAREITYDLGYRSVDESRIALGHDDVLALMVVLLGNAKFRSVLTHRYPVLFIDEYQDTDENVAQAFLSHFAPRQSKLLLGLFGDHWQKIYGSGCGKVTSDHLEVIGKHSNFRSVSAVVSVLNRMRPDLMQKVSDPDAVGSVAVFHTNTWNGVRRTGQHWGGDLPPEVAHTALDRVKAQLAQDGWDLSPDRTKILMLTHNVLADEQGYRALANVFDRNELFIKKEDKHIAFFVDVLEPVCVAYENNRFGEMFAALKGAPAIRTHRDKVIWAENMGQLLNVRSNGSVEQVLSGSSKVF